MSLSVCDMFLCSDEPRAHEGNAHWDHPNADLIFATCNMSTVYGSVPKCLGQWEILLGMLVFSYLITFPLVLSMLPHGLDSNVTKLLAKLLTKPSVFYYFANCIV